MFEPINNCPNCAVLNIDIMKLRAEYARLTAELTAERERNQWRSFPTEIPTCSDRQYVILPNHHITIASYLQSKDLWKLDDGTNVIVLYFRPVLPPEVE